jgi:hypothetical protein
MAISWLKEKVLYGKKRTTRPKKNIGTYMLTTEETREEQTEFDSSLFY